VAPCFFSVNSVLQPADDPALLFVGTIYPLKGLIHLVEALPVIRRRLGRPVRLRVVGAIGGGKQAAGYAKLVHARARECDVAGDIEWLGTVGENGVAALLSRSHALVLPSFQETLPMAVAEAMAAAVPVVATRAGGTPELVEHGRTGLLVAPGRSDELADALGTLLADDTLRRQLGAAGRAKAVATYAPGVVAQQTLAVYKQIVTDGPWPPHPGC
jgi:glycosyltransferase involved in cell wall biosynthesis